MRPLPIDPIYFLTIHRSISIACWVVVFSPQIIENFRRGSADGLSITFIVVWLAGDVFNILGAVLQNVLPTMMILAVYYTLADIVLLAQCFYYRGFTLSDYDGPSSKSLSTVTAEEEGDGSTERSALLANGHSTSHGGTMAVSSIDGSHLSPVTPLVADATSADKKFNPSDNRGNNNVIQTVLFNIFSILLVCSAGVFGWWWINTHPRPHHHHASDSARQKEGMILRFNVPGQIFGYLCAILYLGSRIPQLLLNHRRRSTEGISMLFFLFACIGNLTYVLSIFAFEPACPLASPSSISVSPAGYIYGAQGCQPGEARRVYGRYILVNASWLIGSLGTLLLDLGIFVQFFIYRALDPPVMIVVHPHGDDDL